MFAGSLDTPLGSQANFSAEHFVSSSRYLEGKSLLTVGLSPSKKYLK